MTPGYIPRTLDQQEKFFLWEVDQFVFAVLTTGAGVVSGHMGPGMIAGVVAAYWYGKLKSGKHPKFAIHLLYWWMPPAASIKTKITPPSDCRYFLG